MGFAWGGKGGSMCVVCFGVDGWEWQFVGASCCFESDILTLVSCIDVTMRLLRLWRDLNGSSSHRHRTIHTCHGAEKSVPIHATIPPA